MSKKILIIGNSAKEYALAKKLSEKNEIYVASGSDTIAEFATCVDIREDSSRELLDFVMENDIDITIPISLKSLNSNIVDLFDKNGQQIFAPSLEAVNTIFDKASAKKIFYKLRIPTPRFGIFEKQNMAMDYIKNLKSPIVVKTNEPSSAIVLSTEKSAKNIIDSYFINKNQKVIIEDYIWGTPFAFYALTDGYKALPIGSSILYKHSLEGDGGQLTEGMGSCVPNYKLSIENEYFIMDNIIYPVLEYLEAGEKPYLGVLGVNGIITEDGKIQVLGLSPFMQDCDCSAILELIDTDFVSLIESCLVGSFSDEAEYIPQKDMFATSLVIYSKNTDTHNSSIISGLDLLDENLILTFYPQVRKNKYLEYEMLSGAGLVLTALARTITFSAQKVYSEVENLKCKGISYRKDICKPVNRDY